MIQDWAILKREPAEDFKLFQIQRKQVRSPRTGETREVQAIQFTDWVLILALTADEEVIMVRQYRHGIERVCLELPGGLVDPADDSPALSAQRELLEETGYQAQEWVYLGNYPVDGNRGVGTAYFFLARDARRVSAPDADDLEEQELFIIGRAEMELAITSNEFKLLPWVAIVALALLHLDREDGRLDG